MIKKISFNEIKKIIEIEKEAFNDPWSLEAYEKIFVDYKQETFVFLEGNEVIAYAVFLDMVDVYELIKIAVKKEHRGKKIGFKFLSEIIESLEKNIFLEVREKNIAAITLYEKIGFKVINIRKNYYRDTGEHALIMSYEK